MFSHFRPGSDIGITVKIRIVFKIDSEIKIKIKLDAGVGDSESFDLMAVLLLFIPVTIKSGGDQFQTAIILPGEGKSVLPYSSAKTIQVTL